MYTLLTASVAFAFLPTLAVSQSSSTAPLPNPTKISCPSNVSLVRSAGAANNQTLSSGEHSYITSRTQGVLPGAWDAYLKNVNATSPTPLPSYVTSLLANSSNTTLPRLGIAVSGGSYRAALFGAGALSALDGRNATGRSKGTGGVLQGATYLSGLSGGSWLITSLTQANFPTIPDLVFPPNVSSTSSGGPNSSFGGFLAQVDLLAPASNPVDNVNYVESLISEAKTKQQSSGLPVTITDVWGNAVGRHFINGTTMQNIFEAGTHSAGILLSDFTKLPSFQAHAQPFPIVIVDAIPPNPNTSEIIPGNTVPLTSEIWEFNVFESGSWDPTLASFIPTSLLGSTNSSNCMAGLDQASFIIGMSSNIFNSFNFSSTSLSSSFIGPVISALDSAISPEGEIRLDSGAVPNPFKGVNPSSFTSSNQEFLTFVDGGSNGEVLPLQPLLVRAREIDTIVAIDASADTSENYSNGTDLINTAKRAALFGTQYPFPAVPSTADSFIQLGFTRRPAFFGCNDTTTPLVVYIANGGPPASGAASVTNTSTLQRTYSPQEVQSILDQAFVIATQGINGSDAEWGACLACAAVDRARARAGVQRDGVCVGCFARYCWNGQGGNVTSSGGGGSSSGSISLRGARGEVGLVLGLVIAICVMYM